MNSALEKAVIALAQRVAERAKDKDTPLQESIEATKVLTPLVAMLRKNPPKSDEPPDGGPSFSDFQGMLAEESPGGPSAAVRGRRGARRPDA